MKVMEDEFQKIIEQFTKFDEMYEQVRVVDPIKKEALFILNKNRMNLLPVQEVCFDIWGKDEKCKNCISMRSYNEKESFIKIETSSDGIFMITSIPLEVENRRVVIELIKNVTTSMVLDDVKMSEHLEIKKMLDQANAAVMMDELTGVYNKRYILEQLPAEINNSQLENTPLSVIMADIDHFKMTNDTYGHLAGDYILKEFSTILNRNKGPGEGWLARFGGEEFILCLINTDQADAEIIAENMRKAVESNVFYFDKERIQLTSSFGLYTVNGESMTNYDELISCADQKLYQAKKAGRNCVIK